MQIAIFESIIIGILYIFIMMHLKSWHLSTYAL